MSEPTIYALPDEPEGPVWDRNGDKWERTGDVVYVQGREWAEWRHVASGNVGTWPAPLMRGPVTSMPPWEPVVGGVCETAEQYEAMPVGSVIASSSYVYRRTYAGGWLATGLSVAYSDEELAGISRTILRVGWGS